MAETAETAAETAETTAETAESALNLDLVLSPKHPWLPLRLPQQQPPTPQCTLAPLVERPSSPGLSKSELAAELDEEVMMVLIVAETIEVPPAVALEPELPHYL